MYLHSFLLLDLFDYMIAATWHDIKLCAGVFFNGHLGLQDGYPRDETGKPQKGSSLEPVSFASDDGLNDLSCVEY